MSSAPPSPFPWSCGKPRGGSEAPDMAARVWTADRAESGLDQLLPKDG